jgi:hypothetical protein
MSPRIDITGLNSPGTKTMFRLALSNRYSTLSIVNDEKTFKAKLEAVCYSSAAVSERSLLYATIKKEILDRPRNY